VSNSYDAVLVVSFGGPEKKDDVLPFLENVLRGKPVPRERMLEVAEHYYHFDGVSPLNQQVRDLLEVFKPALKESGVSIPVYWGNRNWHPMLQDTIQQMTDDGVKNALALVLSGYSCYSGCRQYRENVYSVCDTIGEAAPTFDKVRVFYNHPNFVSVNAKNVQKAIDELPEQLRENVQVAYTAHSIPMSMATTSDYEKQLSETCRLVSAECGIPDDQWQLVYQSRSGRPQDPWLEPDICDHIAELGGRDVKSLVVMPIGFLSDHMEVMFDLDEEAVVACKEHGIEMARAATVGTDPEFVDMLVELVRERIDDSVPKLACGEFGPNHDVCPIDCCPAPPRRPRPTTA
jgi:ferrochelatase